LTDIKLLEDLVNLIKNPQTAGAPKLSARKSSVNRQSIGGKNLIQLTFDNEGRLNLDPNE